MTPGPHQDPQSRSRAPTASDADCAQSIVAVVAEALDGYANQVWCFGLPVLSAHRKALGIVAQMAAQLLHGASAMFKAPLPYAAAALVRQLIETDYLLFLFGLDEAEAESWINGTDEDHKRLFQPAAMRRRAGDRFDVEEYSHHCRYGGHPRPAACSLVDRHHTATSDPIRLFWVDLANHAVRVWDHYKLAAERCSPTNVYPEGWSRIDLDCKRWWDVSRACRVWVAEIAAQQGAAADDRPQAGDRG